MFLEVEASDIEVTNRNNTTASHPTQPGTGGIFGTGNASDDTKMVYDPITEKFVPVSDNKASPTPRQD